MIFTIFLGFYNWAEQLFLFVYDFVYSLFHFFFFLIGSNLLFFPMHFLGILGMPRRIPIYLYLYNKWNFYIGCGFFNIWISLFYFFFLFCLLTIILFFFFVDLWIFLINIKTFFFFISYPCALTCLLAFNRNCILPQSFELVKTFDYLYVKPYATHLFFELPFYFYGLVIEYFIYLYYLVFKLIRWVGQFIKPTSIKRLNLFFQI